MVTPSLLS
jgi:hypothetical protein